MIAAQILGVPPVLRHLTGLGPKAQKSVTREVQRLVMTLLRKVKQEKLSGQVLRNQTGTLRRSINSRVLAASGAVTGSVGTNIRYARPHEMGFSGAVPVREHLRLVKQAWGRPVKDPGRHPVRAHTRQVNLPERSFLRSALAEMAPEVRARLADALRVL